MGENRMDMDDYFARLAEELPNLNMWKKQMERLFHQFLANPNEENWSAVKSYLTDEYAGSAINTDGTFFKLHKIISILEVELHFKLPLFTEGCYSLDETIDKYQTLIMMIRRMDLSLENEFQDEAIEWIATHHISGVAIAQVINKELLGNRDNLYQIFSVYMDCISDNFGKQLLMAYRDKE